MKKKISKACKSYGEATLGKVSQSKATRLNTKHNEQILKMNNSVENDNEMTSLLGSNVFSDDKESENLSTGK